MLSDVATTSPINLFVTGSRVVPEQHSSTISNLLYLQVCFSFVQFTFRTYMRSTDHSIWLEVSGRFENVGKHHVDILSQLHAGSPSTWPRIMTTTARAVPPMQGACMFLQTIRPVTVFGSRVREKPAKLLAAIRQCQ